MSSPGSVGADERLRLFLGFRLPDASVREIGRWQRDVLEPPSGVRIVPAENLHVTIAFLGSRPSSELGAIAGALREAAEGAVEPMLAVSRYRETRSVGMLVFEDEGAHATRIAEDAQARLARLGVYEPERRAWLPHLTVVRFRSRPRLQPALPELGRVMLSEAAVYISRLRPTGAQYEVMESVPLGGG
jgi:2'-5' RNA ligase